MKMTFNEYDQKCENIKRIENTKTGWYPSVEDIDKRILPNIEHYLDYLIWLTETSGEPIDEESRAGKKYINEILYREIELVDDENIKCTELIKMTDSTDFIPMWIEYTKELHSYSDSVQMSNNEEASKLYCNFKKNPDVEIYAINANDRVCGFLILGRRSNTHPSTDIYIQELYVKSDFRRKGIGKSVISDLLKGEPARYCLYIIKENKPAKLFWQSIFSQPGVSMLSLSEITPINYCDFYGFAYDERRENNE